MIGVKFGLCLAVSGIQYSVSNIYNAEYNFMGKMNQNKGFTLIEIVVATGIFSLVSVIAVGAFLISLESQQAIVAQKTVAENVRFALEFSSRQMRFAKSDEAGSCAGAGIFFADGGNSIRFLNSNETCVSITLDGERIVYQEGATSAIDLTNVSDVRVTSLNFILNEAGQQPRVTMIVEGVSSRDPGLLMRAQTTTTARNIPVG